jgi:GNAT superfamily N-acetyltransferase
MEMDPIPGVIETDIVTEADEKAMIGLFGAFNETRAGPQNVRPLGLLLRAAPDAPIEGGIIGWSWFGWMQVHFVYLPEHLRGAGLGRRLMQRTEAIARARSCHGIWLDTYSFQARGFYEKLGFSAFGEIEDYPPGHSRIFLKKRLDQNTRDRAG